MTHQWPQNQILIDDHPKSMMDSSSSSSANNKLMEKTNLLDPHQHQHQQTPPPPPPSLKCPRCDSSNTKFCYYNNYSLSQPRHFCKACKRYWTRGGTLRNVPVGGGCRKNKKLRRPSSGGSSAGISAAAATANPGSAVRQQQQIDLSSSQTSNYINNNPSFYPLELNFPFSGYSNSTRVSSDNNNTGFDLQQQPQTMMNGLGLGFSAGFRQIQDNVMTSSSSPFSSTGNYNSHVLFGSSSAFASNTSTMASLLASTLQQQKFGISSTDPASNYEDHTQNRSSLAWNQNNPIYEQIISNSSDPASSSSLVWNTTNNNAGSWFDPSNMGSSVPSLI